MRSTIDQRVQKVVNEALENGLALYEKRHPRARGLTQGSVVVLANADGAILAEAGGRQLYNLRSSRYSDYNRVTGSLRQPGSVMKPLVYLAAFRSGLTLDAHGAGRADQRAGWAARATGSSGSPTTTTSSRARSPLARRSPSRATRSRCGSPRPIGMEKVLRTCRDLGFHTPLQALHQHGPRRVRGPVARARGRLSGHGLGRACGAARDRARHRQHERPPLRGAWSSRGDSLGEPGADPGGASRRDPPSRRHRPRSQRKCLPDSGDGQDGYDERVSGRAFRRVHLRAAGHHGRGPDRLRRQPHAGPSGDRRAHGAADLSARSWRASTRMPWSGRSRSFPGRWRTGSTRT